MDVIRYDLNTEEGYCEFARHQFTHIPAMMYISKSGVVVEQTEEIVYKDALKQKLENLLKQP